MRLIDADMALLDLCGKKCGCVLQECGYNPCDVANLILRQPTIEAQPVKHGRWTECWRDPARHVISVICSACEGASLTYLAKRDLAVDDVPKKICIQMPYCPKCGARMEVEEDEQAQ